MLVLDPTAPMCHGRVNSKETSDVKIHHYRHAAGAGYFDTIAGKRYAYAREYGRHQTRSLRVALSMAACHRRDPESGLGIPKRAFSIQQFIDVSCRDFPSPLCAASNLA
jgi:hypothetical protein